ncbi:MAG: ABC transporter ATP-binding protein [Planctomycetota bacterium]
MTTDNSVDVEGLALARGNFRLGPCSFRAEAAGRIAIVGPSGSGKTTLLRCLAGLDRPQAGTIRIGGTLVHGNGIDVAPNARQLGLVFQDGALWPHMTALQHLRFAAPTMGESEQKALLARAGLGGLEQRKPSSMSGGEAQRLGLVRTIAANPRVLLLDEPLRSVDVHQRDALVLLLRTLCAERSLTSILVTHDRDEALALATDLLVMREGRIVERGAASELLTAPKTAFTAAFLASAACLPVEQSANGTAATPFGAMACSGDAQNLRLVLMPGDVAAEPAQNGTGPRGEVVACLPQGSAFVVRVAFGDQIIPATSTNGIRPGDAVELRLTRPARLLPWDTPHAS